jgi:predicted MPP superfamily phosphohydrolase
VTTLPTLQPSYVPTTLSYSADEQVSRRPREFTILSEPSRSRPRPTTVDPVRVHFNRGWLAAGALGAAGTLAAVARFGRPALLGSVGVGLATLGHMVLGEPRRPVLERVTLCLPGLPPALDGLRIGQISDIHLGLPFAARNLRWAIAKMQREQPDLIVLTGDQVMRHHAIPILTRLLRDLHAPLGVFAIPGNHDYWEGLRDVRAALGVCNIPLMVNENRRLSWNGADFWLVGLDDVWDGELNYAEALRGVPQDGFKVLLGHAPDIADEAATHGFALQLAGHVHGGHMRLPLLGPFVRPRYGVRYLDGLYQVGKMQLYVSRGLGGAPLRLLCPPEAAILTLRAA